MNLVEMKNIKNLKLNKEYSLSGNDQYIIINRQSPLALQKNKAWHIRKKLDLKTMKKGAQLLLGTHDFSTFRASSCGAKSPIKTILGVALFIVFSHFFSWFVLQ